MTQSVEQSRTPTMVEVMNTLASNIYDNTSVCMPGLVKTYDPALRQAEVQPLLNRAVFDEDGNEIQEELPTIPAVPVVFPRGGTFYIVYPLQPGDNVLLVFADRSLETYMLSTGDTPNDQIDLRQHNLSDAIAIPGFFPTGKPILDTVAPTDLVVGKEAGPTITVTTTQVDINGNFTVDL